MKVLKKCLDDITQMCCILVYRVPHHLLGLTDQANMVYYRNKQNLPNVNTLIDTHLLPIYLHGWVLNDLTSYHNKAHLTNQSIQAGGGPPCTVIPKYFAIVLVNHQ